MYMSFITSEIPNIDTNYFVIIDYGYENFCADLTLYYTIYTVGHVFQ